MEYLLIIVIALVVMFFIKLGNTVTKVNKHWHHYFNDFTYSPQDFYQSIASIINEKDIPGVELKSIAYSEGGLLSANREYLRVERGEMVFDICAAPFAKGFFVSSWQGELPQFKRYFFSSIPFVGESLDRAFFTKTYFQMDTELMFANSIHSAVLEAIKGITDDMGIRDLTELERQFNKIGK